MKNILSAFLCSVLVHKPMRQGLTNECYNWLSWYKVIFMYWSESTYCTSIVSHLVGDKSQYIPSTFSQYLWQLIFLFAHIDIELQKNLIWNFNRFNCYFLKLWLFCDPGLQMLVKWTPKCWFYTELILVFNTCTLQGAMRFL